MLRSEVDRSKLSPMMLQYMEMKDKYEDTILFYRIGDFYEMFFDDAKIASKELELVLTGKSCGLESRVPMCGVPHHAKDIYLDKLVSKGYKVAIVEQLTDPDKKGIVERGITQIVTKGTMMDATGLNEKENNFIGSVYDFSHCFLITYADITTGDIYTELISYDKEKLINEVVRLNLKEIIVNSVIDREIISSLRDDFNVLVSISDDIYDKEDYKYIYKDNNDIRLTTGVKHLLSYIIETKKGDLSHLKQLKTIDKRDVLEIDLYSKRNLELVETLRTKERTYSLLWLLDKTKTAMGSRLLKSWVENPLRDKKEIEYRYDIISKFLTEFILKEELREALNNVYDLERLCGRISYGNVNARDLIQLKNSIGELPTISKILEEINYGKSVETLDDLYNVLSSSIKEDAPLTIKEGGIIKDNYDSSLDELRKLSSGSKDFIISLEEEERKRTGIKNLKVGFNKVFGYYIEISKGNIKDIKEEYGYIRKQTLVNGERFITPLLKEKEEIILNADDKINSLEYEIFTKIREYVKTFIPRLQKIASILSEVDALISLAVVSEENSYVRPTIVDNNSIYIKDGRHPVMEKVIPTSYVKNDVIMDEKTNILLITGPNMSGKSTYMRMVAVIIIMAQIGSYVPCNEAKLPIIDKIFTRIGASDDLVGGKSTFMVEMREANNAVSNATKDSLILFDELGRGTATYDGIALAQSILEYIHDNIKAKTLFSTHYHELTTLDQNLRNLKNIHVSAKESDGKITFLHKITNGAVDKSYGIHVASLVNLPKEIITRAEEILNVYENKKDKKEIFEQTTLNFESATKEESNIEKKLKEVDPLKITPIDAMNILYELKKEAESK